MKNWIERWETHCWKIKDYFKNPIFSEYLLDFYKKNDDVELDSWIHWKKKNKFTSSFYEYIRNVFSNKDHLERFLNFIREDFATDTDSWKALRDKFGTGNITNMLIILTELNKMVSEYPSVPVSDIFNQDIIPILNSYKHWFPVDEDVAEEFDVDYEQISTTYFSIAELVENDIIPLSDGKMIALLHKVSDDILRVVELGTEDIFDIDFSGNRVGKNNEDMITETWDDFIDNRRKLLRKIEQYKRILKYDLLEYPVDDLSEEDEQEWHELLMQYEEKKDTYLLDFSHYLGQVIMQADSMLKNMKVEDVSKMIDLTAQWVVFDHHGVPNLWLVEDDTITPITEKIKTGKQALDRKALKILSSH